VGQAEDGELLGFGGEANIALVSSKAIGADDDCVWVSEQRGCEGRLRDGHVGKGSCIWYDDENVAPVKAPSPMPLRWAP
jgi:hypothetical protein